MVLNKDSELILIFNSKMVSRNKMRQFEKNYLDFLNNYLPPAETTTRTASNQKKQTRE
jgi:hypothetical protein